ncbi:APC family permease [Phenylobacterium montanum]|uniref:APC family permease n=1 Tax=Phenylobacterium montanum TaxID=2823693 RepID=A0A975G0L7_9CAUL|nr:APC family permease [Caulobacter sp. S6]QUD88343.1 APC family permease [Caulobacter sp. S6]
MKSEEAGVRGHLLRVFGLGFGLAVVIGGVIGSGIMRNPGIVAAGFPDPKWVLLAWLAGGVVVMIDAMPTVELGAAIPLAGGPYSLAARAFGPLTGFLVGWADWLQNAVSTGFITVAFGEFVQRMGLFTSLTTGEIAIGLVLACGLINWIGTRVGGASQNIGSALKAVGLTILVAALFLAHGKGVAPPAPPPAAFFWGAPAILAIQAIYGAYGGWHAAVYFSEEVHQPERNVARATFGGIVLVTGLYLLVNAAVLKVLPIGVLAQSKLAVADAAMAVLGPISGKIVTGLAIISVATIANLQIMEYVRTGFAMARNGVMPPSLARVSKSGTPRVSLAVVLVVTIAIILCADLIKGQLYQILLEIYAPFVMLVFLVLALASIRLRLAEPDLPRPWKMPLFPLPALMSAAINVVLLVAFFLRNDWKTSASSVGLLAGGMLIYLVGRSRWKPLTD